MDKPSDYIDLTRVVVTKADYVSPWVKDTIRRFHNQKFMVKHLAEVFESTADDELLEEVCHSQLMRAIRTQLARMVESGEIKELVSGVRGRAGVYQRTGIGEDDL